MPHTRPDWQSTRKSIHLCNVQEIYMALFTSEAPHTELGLKDNASVGMNQDFAFQKVDGRVSVGVPTCREP